MRGRTRGAPGRNGRAMMLDLRPASSTGQETRVDYQIKQYSLQQGALEIQYIEEFFNEFPRRKTAAEIISRLEGRAHQILMAEAPLADDPTGALRPVSFKVAHALHARETDPKLADLVARLDGHVKFYGRKVRYQRMGGARGAR